jgi:hypothetical protein
VNAEQQWWLRLGLLSELIEQAPGQLGRTAVMKLAYLLQVVKEVPLGYDFRLYTYGPFESDVLSDLGVAESLGAIQSQIVYFPSGSGYGYEFRVGPGRETVMKRAGAGLTRYQPDIRWALEEFGRQSAADLELITTIIYADREATRRKDRLSLEELGRKVKEVKPRFADRYIMAKIEDMASKGLIATPEEKPVS